jgi:hypothetical protein
LAAAAGLSRVTLHRIETGNPSITLGAHLNALDALDMSLCACDGRPEPAPAPRAPGTVRVGDYPQPKSISWQLRDDTEMTEEEALRHYARSWRYIDEGALEDAERALIEHLRDAYGEGATAGESEP